MTETKIVCPLCLVTEVKRRQNIWVSFLCCISKWYQFNLRPKKILLTYFPPTTEGVFSKICFILVSISRNFCSTQSTHVNYFVRLLRKRQCPQWGRFEPFAALKDVSALFIFWLEATWHLKKFFFVLTHFNFSTFQHFIFDCVVISIVVKDWVRRIGNMFLFLWQSERCVTVIWGVLRWFHEDASKCQVMSSLNGSREMSGNPGEDKFRVPVPLNIAESSPSNWLQQQTFIDGSTGKIYSNCSVLFFLFIFLSSVSTLCLRRNWILY